MILAQSDDFSTPCVPLPTSTYRGEKNVEIILGLGG